MYIITRNQGHGELTFMSAIWSVGVVNSAQQDRQDSSQLLFSQSSVTRSLSPSPHDRERRPDNIMKKSQFIKSSILTDSLAVRCADFTPSGKI